MGIKYTILLSAGFLMFFCSCTTTHVQSTDTGMQVSASNTMTCKIKGQIVEILPAAAPDANSACAKHPCKAKVSILESINCGASVSAPLHAGDTAILTFGYTLDKTKKIFPDMKAQYPGLKKGDIFSAEAEYRLRPTTNGEFTVFGYTAEK